MRQETQGRFAMHGGDFGETWTSRPRCRRAWAVVLGKRGHHRPATATCEREKAGSPRRLKRQKRLGSRVPVRTFMDWKEPEIGYLEIDLVAHCGGTVTGSFINSLVATDVCSEGRRRCRFWHGSRPWWWRDSKPYPESFRFQSVESIRTTTVCSSTRHWWATAPTEVSSSRGPVLTARTTRYG